MSFHRDDYIDWIKDHATLVVGVVCAVVGLVVGKLL